MILKFGRTKLLITIIATLLLTNLAVYMNILFLRQISGFLFLSLLPGVLILQMLRLNRLNFLENFILSWGLSISFLMFFGLLLNNLSLSLGYSTPLSTASLMISLNITLILLLVVERNLNKDLTPATPTINLSLNTVEKAFLVVPSLFPTLSIFGMHSMNNMNNNYILLILHTLIPAYIIFICIFDHKVPMRIYPTVLLLISISLTLLLSLRSNHIIGYDSHLEYAHFSLTLKNLYWSIVGYCTLDACISISILPAIYHSVLNVNSEILFKILYSLLYSVSPLAVYTLSKRYVKETYAFLASCFYMFQPNFLGTAMNARTNIAMLFFSLAMMTYFNNKIDLLKKRILFIIFMASCILSHYSTSYIFFFIMVGNLLGSFIMSRKYTFKRGISFTLVILFFASLFLWYSQLTEIPFIQGTLFIERTLVNLNKFFIQEARDESVQVMFGRDLPLKTTPAKIRFVFSWITLAFIAVGIITLIFKRRNMSLLNQELKKSDFLKDKFEVEYFVIALICSGISGIIVILPYVSIGYSIDRTYSTVLTILSVFFVIGGIILARYFETIFKNLANLWKGRYALKERNIVFIKKASHSKIRFNRRNRPEILSYYIILLSLIPYYLCVSGVMYNIFGVPRDITLNSEGDLYNALYVSDTESYCARWLGNYAREGQKIYVDGYNVMDLIRSQAGIIPYDRYDRDLMDLLNDEEEGYIYLDNYNTAKGLLRNGYNISKCSNMFIGKNKIYDNGQTQIWN